MAIKTGPAKRGTMPAPRPNGGGSGAMKRYTPAKLPRRK